MQTSGPNMPAKTERLRGPAALKTCVDLQQRILGDRARTVWDVAALTAVCQSGGLVLGVQHPEGSGPRLRGAIVDLVASIDRYPARHTVFRAVLPSERNHGIGYGLRVSERRICQQDDVDLVFWSLDPLRSDEAYLAFGKLGAVATGYRQELYGEIHDSRNLGLPTDRLHVEWWIDSPRVSSILDRGNPPPYFKLGVHEMNVLTKTRLASSGIRRLVGYDDAPRAEHVLVEIPVDLDKVRDTDLAIAREWRSTGRQVFELLFERGYVGVGFVHEGGRSFHLFHKTDRRAALRDC